MIDNLKEGNKAFAWFNKGYFHLKKAHTSGNDIDRDEIKMTIESYQVSILLRNINFCKSNVKKLIY